MLLSQNYSSSWDDLLDEVVRNELEEIELKIGNNYTPKINNILRFMNNDLDKIKVCIIGQDPYYSVDNDELVATGRAFQPNNLIDWSQSYRQVSLKNMIRLIHKSYVNIEKYEDIKSYKEIALQIRLGEFEIKQPREWYDSMENQGVLFLNRYLTTEVGIANAHRKIWHEFVANVIRYIDEKRSDMIWFLWGKEAIESTGILENGKVYTSRHPMMCSKKYDDDFLKSECFKETMNIINWLG